MIAYIVGTLLAVILGFVVRFFFTWDHRFEELSKRIPSPPGVPIFGNTFQLLVASEKLLSVFDAWIDKHGHRLLYRIGTYWIVSLSNAKDVEKLLTSTTETVKSVDYDQLIPWLGTGLLISNGEKWAKRRKLLTPAFHFKILEKFMDVFNQQSFKFVDIIQTKFEPGQVLNVTPLISKLTLDIICETAMGVEINAQGQDEDTEYISAISRMKFMQQYRAFRPWLDSDFVWDTFSYGKEEARLIKIAHDFTNKVIKQRKEEFLRSLSEKSNTDDDANNEETRGIYGGKKRSAFLDLLLEAQHRGDLKSDEDVREETDTFMFEGHDTVSAGIAFTLFLLGNHPEIQEKVQNKLDSIFGTNQTRPITIEDLGRMKYLECCIKESLRLLPSVPMIARSIQQDFQLDEGVILPGGTIVLILQFQLHRNKDVFPEPLRFLPERFLLDEASVIRHPFAFVPFSAGPRNCIGQKFALMEEKVVIANVLRQLSLSSVEKLEDLTLVSDIILHSKHGISLKYSTRFG